MPCVFCSVACGDLPAWIVYENADIMAFLPESPEAFGHTLLAPRTHHPDLSSIPPDLLAKLTHAVQGLSRRYGERIGADGMNVLLASGPAAQQSVDHLHLHLIPRFFGDGLNLWPTLPGVEFDKDSMLRALRGDLTV